MKTVIGLTGGIACGKSVVSAYLKEKGYLIIDADLIARECVAPGSLGIKAVAQAFGQEYVKDGILDRAKLAELIFSDEQAREKLNRITWPLITEKVLQMIQENEGLIFLDAALLFESNMDKLCDQIWLVKADETIQRKRLMERNRLTAEEAQNRIAAQGNWNEKEALVQQVFDNNGTKNELYEKIEKALEQIQEI